MIFFVANDGTIIKSLPSPVYQGGANTNTIYLVAPFAANMKATVRFRLPNGVWTEPALMTDGLDASAMTAQGAVDELVNANTGQKYAVWSYALSGNITQYYGTVTAQFFFYAAQSGVVTATSSTQFTVGRGVPTILPDTPTEDVYEAILSNLSALEEQLDNGSYAARSIYAWNNTYTYGANELVFYPNKGEYGVFLKSLVADNTEEPYTDEVLNAENWEEVINFNVLNGLYNLQIELQAGVDSATQSAASALQSATQAQIASQSAEESLESAQSAAQSAEEYAEIARQFAEYGIKINVDYDSVDSLPTPGNSQYIYLIPNGSEGTNGYDEYIWVDGKNDYEKIGTTEIDLTSYATKEELETYATKEELAGETQAREEAIKNSQAYDLIIRTQEEFEAFYATLDDGTCEAHSVLLVGDGGTLEFTRSDGRGLHLPDSLYQLDGINNAIIDVTNFSYNATTNLAAVWYTELPNDNLHSLNNLTVSCTSNVAYEPNHYCFANCVQLNNCNGDCSAGTNIKCYGFYNCEKLTNCNGSGSGSGTEGCGFANCNRLTNCNGDGTGSVSTGYGYYHCKQLSECNGKGTGTGPGAKSYGFYGCEQLSNCKGNTILVQASGGSGYCFYNCSYTNGCKRGDISSTGTIWGGTITYRDDESCQLT